MNGVSFVFGDGVCGGQAYLGIRHLSGLNFTINGHLGILVFSGDIGWRVVPALIFNWRHRLPGPIKMLCKAPTTA